MKNMILLMVKMSNFVLNQNAWLFQNEKVENSKTKKINGYLKRKKKFWNVWERILEKECYLCAYWWQILDQFIYKIF